MAACRQTARDITLVATLHSVTSSPAAANMVVAANKALFVPVLMPKEEYAPADAALDFAAEAAAVAEATALLLADEAAPEGATLALPDAAPCWAALTFDTATLVPLVH